MIPARFAVLVVSLLLMTLAACGGSSEPEEPAAPPLATAAPVQDADIEATVEARVADALATAVAEATPMTPENTSKPAPTALISEEMATREPAPPVPRLIEFQGPTISAGDHYTCGLLANGTLECWGYLTDTLVCVAPERGAADGYDPERCWPEGDNRSGMPPAGSFSSITSGPHHMCALKEDGTGLCWGGGPIPNSMERRYASIAAGLNHTCGLRESGKVECWGITVGTSYTLLTGSFRL